MEILTAVLIIHLWNGVVSVHPTSGWAPGLAVIRTQAELDRFVSHIPRNKLQQRQPAPPSDDPLLKGVRIDFSKRMVIVVTSSSVLTKVEIPSVERGARGMFVHVRRRSLGQPNEVAHPIHYGTYAAVEVERFVGDVQLLDNTP